MERAWVHGRYLNYPGDYVHHRTDGLAEGVQERAEAKTKDQAKADKKRLRIRGNPRYPNLGTRA